MELTELVGKHLLSGIDITIEETSDRYYTDTANVVLFILDGITYKAVEDPSDGYRSYLKELIISNEKVSNIFPPQEVVGKMKDNEKYSINDTIQFFDTTTGKVVLEVGTDNTDDYYPYCVIYWNPENLAINIGR